MSAAADSVADVTHDLYRRYGKQIYAYCLYHLRSREEAEDAVQTTFLNAFRGLQRGTTMRFEQAWLYKIAQNVCIARRSSAGRRLKLEAPDDFELLQESLASRPGSGDWDTLELMGLDEALDSMPDNQRRAILLREWQGLSYREIARELDLSQGAVEMLIFRARRTLASALEQPVMRKRRRTAESAGSLIPAMKSLLSGSAAVKMAAVAAGAGVIGTSAVHSVVQQTFDVRSHGGVRERTSATRRTAATRHVVRRTTHAAVASHRAARPVQASAAALPARAKPRHAADHTRPPATADTSAPILEVQAPDPAPAPAEPATPASAPTPGADAPRGHHGDRGSNAHADPPSDAHQTANTPATTGDESAPPPAPTAQGAGPGHDHGHDGGNGR